MEFLKAALSLMADAGTGVVMGDVISHAVDFKKMSRLKKVCATIGMSAMSLMVSEKVADYVEDKVDAVAKAVNIFKDPESVVVDFEDFEEVGNHDNVERTEE